MGSLTTRPSVGLRVTDRGDTLVVEDTPGCLWLFGAWFVGGGLIALAMPFVAVNRDAVPWWGRLLVVLIGIATMSAGAFVIRAHPTRRTEIDRRTGTVRVTKRQAFGRRSIEELPVSTIGVVQVFPSRDSDGDVHYALNLVLEDGRTIPLHSQPVYGKEWIDELATRVRQYVAIAVRPNV